LRQHFEALEAPFEALRHHFEALEALEAPL